MRSSYKKLGPYIREVKVKNSNLEVGKLLGVSITKEFIPSIANTIGTDMSTYKIVRTNQFAYGPVTSRNGDKISVALLQEDNCIISTSYTVFEIIDKEKLLPEYLMIWFRRPEFDRYARYMSHGSVREIFGWDEMCDLELPIPSIETQLEIVKEYQTIVKRIKLNEQLNRKLEETAQAIYKQWFVEFEFPLSKEYALEIGKPELEGKPYKSCGGEMVRSDKLDQKIPKGWSLGSLTDHAEIIMGQSPKGDTYNTDGIGTPLINGPVEFGSYFLLKAKWTDSPTKLCKSGDLIVCVRGSTTGRFVKSDGEYCLGRGVCSFQAKYSQCFVDLLYKSVSSEMLKLTTGSTFPNWGRDTLSSFPVIVPKNSVIISFEHFISKIISRIETTNKESIILENLKNILHSKMSKMGPTV